MVRGMRAPAPALARPSFGHRQVLGRCTSSLGYKGPREGLGGLEPRYLFLATFVSIVFGFLKGIGSKYEGCPYFLKQEYFEELTDSSNYLSEH